MKVFISATATVTIQGEDTYLERTLIKLGYTEEPVIAESVSAGTATEEAEEAEAPKRGRAKKEE